MGKTGNDRLQDCNTVSRNFSLDLSGTTALLLKKHVPINDASDGQFGVQAGQHADVRVDAKGVEQLKQNNAF